MSRDSSWLLVRAGPYLVGLALTRVVEVRQTGAVHPVPSREPAVRGVTSIRGRLLPVVDLGALLQGRAGSAPPGETLVVTELDGRRLGLAVDEAEDVVLGSGLPVPEGGALPWASAVTRHGGRLVPLLDLDLLATRITETASA